MVKSRIVAQFDAVLS